jgi:cytochrome c
MGGEPGAGMRGGIGGGEAEEVGGGIDIEPGRAESGMEAEAGGLGEAVGEGIFGGPFDVIEEGGGEAAEHDGVVAAVLGGAEGEIGGAGEEGVEMGGGERGGVTAEEQDLGGAAGEGAVGGVPHALAEVEAGLEAAGEGAMGPGGGGGIGMEFDEGAIVETGEEVERVCHKGGVQFGALIGVEQGLESGFDLARDRRFCEKQDDGGHMAIVKFCLMSKTIVCSIGAAAMLTLSLVAVPAPAAQNGKADKGKEVFEQCSVCHNSDSDEKKMGPGLKGLFKKEKMSNGKKPTEENVRGLINQGGNGMPAYEELLSKEERDDLLAYLKTL